MQCITIHPPELIEDGKTLTVLTRVAAPELFPNMPGGLWYRFPAHYRAYITERSDAQLAGLYMAAMGYGMDLEIQGPVSARLVEGLNELQPILVRLMPREMKRMTIHAPDTVSAISTPLPTAVGTNFSGGVDSSFTLWSHLAQNDPNPKTRVTHGLFVQGLDIGDSQNYELCRSSYERMYHRLGLTLLSAQTNVRLWYPQRDWAWFSIAPSFSAALVFGRLFGRFYSPAGYWIQEGPPYSEIALIDRYFSTETMQLEPDGVETTRANKTFAIAGWTETYDSLRVCYKKLNGLVNCCRCDKCLMTMLVLEMAGALGKYKTFPLPLTRPHIYSIRYHARGRIIYGILAKARELGREDLVRDISIVIMLNRARWFVKHRYKRVQSLSPRRQPRVVHS